MISAQCYDTPGEKLGRRFVRKVGAELWGVFKWKWKSELFVLFQMVNFQQVRHVSGVNATWHRIANLLDA